MYTLQEIEDAAYTLRKCEQFFPNLRWHWRSDVLKWEGTPIYPIVGAVVLELRGSSLFKAYYLIDFMPNCTLDFRNETACVHFRDPVSCLSSLVSAGVKFPTANEVIRNA